MAPVFCFAQYIHYSDNSIKRSIPVPILRHDESWVKEVLDLSKKHPDDFTSVECPGLSASLPVLNNYVPPDLVIKLRVRFSGHLFSITSQTTPIGGKKYKLKVCVKGEFHELFVDPEGALVD